MESPVAKRKVTAKITYSPSTIPVSNSTDSVTGRPFIRSSPSVSNLAARSPAGSTFNSGSSQVTPAQPRARVRASALQTTSAPSPISSPSVIGGANTASSPLAQLNTRPIARVSSNLSTSSSASQGTSSTPYRGPQTPQDSTRRPGIHTTSSSSAILSHHTPTAARRTPIRSTTTPLQNGTPSNLGTSRSAIDRSSTTALNRSPSLSSVGGKSSLTQSSSTPRVKVSNHRSSIDDSAPSKAVTGDPVGGSTPSTHPSRSSTNDASRSLRMSGSDVGGGPASAASADSNTPISSPVNRLREQAFFTPLRDEARQTAISPRSPAREAARRARMRVEDDQPSLSSSHPNRLSSSLRDSSAGEGASDQEAWSAGFGTPSTSTGTSHTSFGSLEPSPSVKIADIRNAGDDPDSSRRASIDGLESNDPSYIQDSERALDAKQNRKIADLEISNASLLTVNRTLEAAAAKKDRLISSLKRQLRASGQAPLSYFESQHRHNRDHLDSPGLDNAEMGDDVDDEEEDVALEIYSAVDESLTRLNIAIEDLVRRGREAIEKVEHTREGERGKVLTALDLEERDDTDPQADGSEPVQSSAGLIPNAENIPNAEKEGQG